MCISCIDSLLLQVTDIEWPKKNGYRRDFAFVVFTTPAEAEAALSVPYQTFDGWKVYCPSISLIDILLYCYMYEYDIDIIRGVGVGESLHLKSIFLG